MPARNPALGVGLVVLGATCFVVNAGVSRVALRAGVEPAMLTTVRITSTWAILLLIAVVFRRSALRPPTGRLLRLVLAHGLVGVALLQWTYFVAIDRLPVGMALLLGPALKSCSRRQDAQSRNLRHQPGPTGRFRFGGSSPRPV